VQNWLKQMGKTRHLISPKNAEMLSEIESEVDRRWCRLKCMHEHPGL